MFRLKPVFFLLLFLFTGIMLSPAEAQDSNRLIIQDPALNPPAQYIIREVTFTGLVTGREQFLLSSSGLQVGNAIQIPGDDIAHAIRQLYRTGIFSDVQIFHQRVGSNGVNIEIRVQEQPRLQRYEIEGVKRSERRELREQLNLLSGFAVTTSVREQALSTIRRYYREKGYWGTRIDVYEELSGDDRNRVTITFDINPGERTKVREISFTGNNTFSERKIRKEFSTIKQDRWWRIFKRHVYTRDEYQEGISNVIQFYRDNGFLDVRVLADTVYVDDWRRKQGVFFDLNIEEGPQYRIRNIEWEGNTVYSDEQLTFFFGFEKGDIFDDSRFNENLSYRRDEGDIRSLYENIGYLFFGIDYDLQFVDGDSVDVSFEIVENEIATIRRVSFHGNVKTHDDVVRRTIRTAPGQTYSRSAIVRSIRELAQLGYFNPEGISPDLQPDIENQTVDIIYGLDETQGTDNFEFSGGFGGRQIGIILAARVNFNNFSARRIFEPGGWSPIPSGDGQRLSLGVQVTGRGYQSYNFSFTEPWLRGRPTSLGVSLSYDFLNFSRIRTFNFFGAADQPDRRNELFNASVSIGRRLQWPDDLFTQRFILSYSRYNVLGFSNIFDDGRANLLTLRQVIERNSTDNPISPRSGSRFSASAEFALPVPGFNQFYKLRSDYQHHHTIFSRLVLSATAEYGYMGYFSDNKQSNFQRFFIGGTQLQQRQNFLNDNIDMRGFPGGFNGVISPLDENQNLVGGRVYNKYSLELRYPAVNSEQLQLIPYLFMDAGNAFNNLAEYDPFSLKRAAGFGTRIFLPILGLIDLSYGYRFDGTPASTEGSGLQGGQWEFLFNIGAPF
ncbi:MAG: outer membrane protein assembly factor BamA [Balneolaceae bacterium]|nr:MAG: outer membrane protein assembly factor BamA [Balneolaceae bacterium]